MKWRTELSFLAAAQIGGQAETKDNLAEFKVSNVCIRISS